MREWLNEWYVHFSLYSQHMDSSTKVDFINAFRQRTKAAALRIIKLYQSLPPTGEAQVLGKQLLRSATSVAANYRAVCRARSAKEQYAKLCVCVEEADESQLWLELLGESGIVSETKLAGLGQKFLEIVSVLEKARSTHKGKE
jgi:four helix bundle protein